MEAIAAVGWVLAALLGAGIWHCYQQIDQLRAALVEQQDREQQLKASSTQLKLEADATLVRVRRTAADQVRFASDGLLRDIVPVLDDLGRALRCAAGDGLREGVGMVRSRFLQQLERHGVTPVQTVGRPFDPKLHEAVEQELTSDAEPGTVVAEWQAGYLLHDRLLRPAKVVVAAEPREVGEE